MTLLATLFLPDACLRKVGTDVCTPSAGRWHLYSVKYLGAIIVEISERLDERLLKLVGSGTRLIYCQGSRMSA